MTIMPVFAELTGEEYRQSLIRRYLCNWPLFVDSFSPKFV